MIVLPTRSKDDLIAFLTDHRDLMFRYMVKEITSAVRADDDIIDILGFGETTYFLRCHRAI